MARTGFRRDLLKRLSLKRAATIGAQKVKQLENELQQSAAEEMSETQYGEQKIQTAAEDIATIAGEVSLESVRNSTAQFRTPSQAFGAQLNDGPPGFPEGRSFSSDDDNGTRAKCIRESLVKSHVTEQHQAAAAAKRSDPHISPNRNRETKDVSARKSPMARYRTQVIRRGAIQKHLEQRNVHEAKAAKLPRVGKEQGTTEGTRQMVNNAGRHIKMLAAKMVSKVSSVAWPVLSGCVIVLLVVLMFGSIAVIVGSPMGILFADEAQDSDSIPISSIVAEISEEFTDALEAEVAAHPECEEVDIQYLYPQGFTWSDYWPEIIALYAVDANLSSGENVIVIDEKSKEHIRAIFWQMHQIVSAVEQIEIQQELPEAREMPDDELASGLPEPTQPPPIYKYILHITVRGKTVHEIASILGFTAEQNEILNELLSESMRLSLLPLCYGVAAGAIGRLLPGCSNITTVFGVNDAFGDPGHRGIDVAVPEETPVCAAHSSTRTLSAWSDSYGNQMGLGDGVGMVTRYAHMVELAVATRDVVSTGHR